MSNIFLSLCAIFFKVIISMSISKSAFCVGWFPMIIFQAFLFLVRSLLTFSFLHYLFLCFLHCLLNKELQALQFLNLLNQALSSILLHSIFNCCSLSFCKYVLMLLNFSFSLILSSSAEIPLADIILHIHPAILLLVLFNLITSSNWQSLTLQGTLYV